nr:MAG TPA: hypothetical protein [Bacteriophage sp.]
MVICGYGLASACIDPSVLHQPMFPFLSRYRPVLKYTVPFLPCISEVPSSLTVCVHPDPNIFVIAVLVFFPYIPSGSEPTKFYHLVKSFPALFHDQLFCYAGLLIDRLLYAAFDRGVIYVLAGYAFTYVLAVRYFQVGCNC